jgi:hypothetical protein
MQGRMATAAIMAKFATLSRAISLALQGNFKISHAHFQGNFKISRIHFQNHCKAISSLALYPIYTLENNICSRVANFYIGPRK